MPDIEEMKNKAEETMQDAEGQAQGQDQAQGQGQSMKDKATGMMDEAKGKMDVTGDGKVNADDVKKMGEDAVNKVKGLFKRD